MKIITEDIKFKATPEFMTELKAVLVDRVDEQEEEPEGRELKRLKDRLRELFPATPFKVEEGRVEVTLPGYMARWLANDLAGYHISRWTDWFYDNPGKETEILHIIGMATIVIREIRTQLARKT